MQQYPVALSAQMSLWHVVVKNNHFYGNEMNQTIFDDFKPLVISAVIVMNITLNGLVLAVITKYPQLREDRTSPFIFSLTLSDLANGCTAMPISAAVCSKATPSVRNMLPYIPRVLQECSVCFNYTSVHSLCCVTLCKIVAITKQFRYEQLLTRNRCYLIIACIWLTGGVLATSGTYVYANVDLGTCIYALPAISNVMMHLVSGAILALLVPVAAIVYATTKIFCVIVRTHHQMTSQVNSISGYSGNTHSLTLKAIRSGRNVLFI